MAHDKGQFDAVQARVIFRQYFQFGRRQAEALFQVGRTNELDVLRARRSELNSRDDLLAAEEDYELALDRFRIYLGLPAEDAIDVTPEAPAFVPAPSQQVKAAPAAAAVAAAGLSPLAAFAADAQMDSSVNLALAAWESPTLGFGEPKSTQYPVIRDQFMKICSGIISFA